MSLLIIGGSSGLGQYLLISFRKSYELIINFSKSKEATDYNYNYHGDINNINNLEKIFEKHVIECVILAIKPNLLGTTLKTFIEVNYNGVKNVLELTEKYTVKRLIYISSIACANHYNHNIMCSEKEDQPLLSDYESPYDLTKRMGEDLILNYNSSKLKTISLRIGGLISNTNDTYTEHLQNIVMFGFSNHVHIDTNYSGNVSDALLSIDNKLKEDIPNNISGKFYYYTGEHVSPTDIVRYLAKKQSKICIILPKFILQIFQKQKKNINRYDYIHLISCASYEQTFDNTLFYKTFKFNENYKLFQGIDIIYGSDKTPKNVIPVSIIYIIILLIIIKFKKVEYFSKSYQIAYLFILLSLPTYITTIHNIGLYGKHAKTKLTLNSKMAWTIMESSSIVSAVLTLSVNLNKKVNILSAFFFLLHYIHRSFIYTRFISSKSVTPINIFISSFIFCTLNGYCQASSWFYNKSTITELNKYIGIILFVFGMSLNILSDYYMLYQKKKYKKYILPSSIFHKFILSPNYLGEIIEWIGYAILVNDIRATSFAIFTISNLVPRAVLNLDYYIELFNVNNKKAIIPFIW